MEISSGKSADQGGRLDCQVHAQPGAYYGVLRPEQECLSLHIRLVLTRKHSEKATDILIEIVESNNPPICPYINSFCRYFNKYDYKK
jgi:hypothetical protein